MNIITISREFGSGGRELGKRLADILSYAYYDKEIITEIAKNTSLDKGYIENSLDKGFTTLFPYHFGRSFTSVAPYIKEKTGLLSAQTRVIKEIAKKGESCIIVGRGSDTTLADYSPFKVFVYADIKSKIKRCRQRAGINEDFTDKQIIKRAKEIDGARAELHNLVSNIPWGTKEGYDICINTSDRDIASVAKALATYVTSYKS